MTATVAPFGNWHSPLQPQALFARPSAPMYPCWHHGALYWLEARAEEAGRQVLMCRGSDGREKCLTPSPFNIRSRVHEYGGKCFVLLADSVVFCHFNDQRLYRQALDPDANPEALTPARNADGSMSRFADLIVNLDQTWVIGVVEREYDGREHRNDIAAIRLDSDTATREPIGLVTDADFVAAPALSPDGRRLAWLQWNHPHMPWDSSNIEAADVVYADDGIAIANRQRVAGGDDMAVCEPLFMPDGTLLFAMDYESGIDLAEDFWNLHVAAAEVRRLTTDHADYGAAHWVFGETRMLPLDGSVLSVRTVEGSDELVTIDVENGRSVVHDSQFVGLRQLALVPIGAMEGMAQSAALMIAASAEHESALVRFEPATNHFEILKRAEPLLADIDVSTAQAITFATRDGGTAHAFYYAPRNSQYCGPRGALPPLMVLVHGGPTACASPEFAAAKQYWTTRGFAVLDVNHRGSTGYGRGYRQALRGCWGEIDFADVADAVRYAIGAGLADPHRICIRGGSAGGYVVLRALTCCPELFACGACYYGIGNLVTLAETTHKFESPYTERIIGKEFAADSARLANSRYHARSPVFAMHRVRTPLILFQGGQDAVVPPQVSREVVDILKQNKVIHEYVEYPHEGHGFRSADVRIDALSREVHFYNKVLQLEINVD